LISPSQDFRSRVRRPPDDPHRMVGFEQIIEGFPAHLNLVADGNPSRGLAGDIELGSLGREKGGSGMSVRVKKEAVS